MKDMTGFIHLLASGANGILTLEGQNTTCADVFYVWVCIAYHLEEVLANPSIGVSELRSDVIKTYNHRFNQMMTESSHHIFLLAYYLHPCESKFWHRSQVHCLTFPLVFRHHGGLQLTMPVPLPNGQTLRLDQYPTLFVTLLTSVLKIFQGEQLLQLDSGVEVVPQLIQEFTSYAYNKEPFCSHPFGRDVKPLKWWTQLSKDSNARLIAVSHDS